MIIISTLYDQHINADKPQISRGNDLFGYAPFADVIAKTIINYSHADGLVMALHGPWGIGKSSVLSFIEQKLKESTETEQPVIVNFNPWWFSGNEDLAHSFLGQLQAILPNRYEKFKKLGSLISSFSGAFGKTAEAFIPIPFGKEAVGKFVEDATKIFSSEPKDIPKQKEAVAKELINQKKRILVIVDDIDRLTPDEVRQLFTVIKAVADFPYVTYLLAFDRDVAAEAISKQTGLPGSKFIDKIIQVGFEMPLLRQSDLLAAVAKGADQIMREAPPELLDEMYWSSFIDAGYANLFRVPRDIVRLMNALRVTYPTIKDSVNAVDFLILETLRILYPVAYDSIRLNPSRFITPKFEKTTLKFHTNWLEKIPNELKETIINIITIAFPNVRFHEENKAPFKDSPLYAAKRRAAAGGEIFRSYFCLNGHGEFAPEEAVRSLWLRAYNETEFTNDLNHLAIDRIAKKKEILALFSTSFKTQERESNACAIVMRSIILSADNLIGNIESNNNKFQSIFSIQSLLINITLNSYQIIEEAYRNDLFHLALAVSPHPSPIFIAALKNSGVMPSSAFNKKSIFNARSDGFE